MQPSYDAGIAAVGLSMSGQTSTPVDDFNTYTVRGTAFFNGFVKVRPIENVEVGLDIKNLFDTLDHRRGGSIVPISPPLPSSSTPPSMGGRSQVRYDISSDYRKVGGLCRMSRPLFQHGATRMVASLDLKVNLRM